MNLQEYKAIYNDEDNLADNIEAPPKELVEAWLDTKVEVLEHLERIKSEQRYNLAWGDFIEKDGEYQYEAQICGMPWDDPKTIHLWKGIDKIAEILEVDLTLEKINYAGGRVGWRYSFPYKGRTVIQLADYEGDKLYDGKDRFKAKENTNA